MKKIKRKETNEDLVPSVDMVPEGKYISVVTDAFTAEIEPVSPQKDLVHVIVHSLLNLNDFQHYTFYETISPYDGAPRTEAFVETLESYDLNFFPDDELVGLVEKVRIVYDFLNGYAIPIISERKRMLVDDSTEIVDEDSLPF